MTEKKTTGLELLREPFPAHQISKLPKPTRAQTDAVRQDYKAGIRCEVCGGWHHPKVVHLDYVGHAALTDRLLDCDPQWSWEPLAKNEAGLPAFDENGGLWINLTVCGMTRPGYGHPDGKRGGDAVKEAIGDALRNAAMRFGAALDLWHKGDLHGAEDDTGHNAQSEHADVPEFQPVAYRDRVKGAIERAATLADLGKLWKSEAASLSQLKELDPPKFNELTAAKNARKAALTPPDPAMQAPEGFEPEQLQ